MRSCADQADAVSTDKHKINLGVPINSDKIIFALCLGTLPALIILAAIMIIIDILT